MLFVNTAFRDNGAALSYLPVLPRDFFFGAYPFARFVKEYAAGGNLMGDALSQKTFIADVLEKKPQKNTGQLPQYYVTDNHEAIIPREMFKRVQFERARRGSLEPKGTKTKTNAGRFRPQYVLTEILLCGECGEHYLYHRAFYETKWV